MKLRRDRNNSQEFSPPTRVGVIMPHMNTNRFIDSDALSTHYPAHITELKKRHDTALEKAGANHAVIYSGSPLPVFLDDYKYPFKANPHFVSWAPLTALPHSYIVYTPGEKPVLVYFQEKDYWHLAPTDPEGYWTPYFDIRVVHEINDVLRHLPEDRDKCILIAEMHDEAQSTGIERLNPTTVMNILHYARGAKTAYELECMRQASARGATGHAAAEAAFRNGESEFDIHLAYCRAVDHGEQELPYGNIVALNQNGAVLHYQYQSRQVPDKVRSFLIDAGAHVHRYASDITRTYSYDDEEFSDLVQQFNTLELGLVGEVKAGVNYADLHVMAHRRIAEFLAENGFASGSPEAMIESGVTAAFFPHGLGHLLGLQVHDVGGFMADDSGNIIDRPSGHPYLRLTRPLQADMVLTIEPGVYVIDMLLENLKGTPAEKMVNHERIDWLRPFGGIRIEDNVRVMEGGSENLTREAFARL